MAKRELTRCNEWMFQTVKCVAYMKKVKDGRCILHYGAGETQSGHEEWYYAEAEKDGEEGCREIPDDEVGGSDFVKTYYERVAKDFVGIVVGFELLTVTAELFLDFYEDEYRDIYFANKTPKEQVKCAKVYFGCNRSRYVPMDDMVILQEDVRSGKAKNRQGEV